MSKFIQVKNKIATLEQGRFQTLCNEFLKQEYKNDLQSPGSVDHNEKTRKGRPDAFLHSNTNRYILCEYTTQDETKSIQFAAKLKKDLADCLDFTALGIPQESVELIVLCCNSSVPIILDKELHDLVPNGISLRIIGIETLSTYFSREGRVFARDYLDIAYDTGQILSKDDFLKRYGKKDLATPLNNQLFGREKELPALIEAISNSQLIVLSGPAGAGKTRIVMEAIDLFILDNRDFVPYYVFDKTGSIADDLLTYLVSPKKYILLVDDGNRQANNLLAIIQQAVEGGVIIKTIITVRDYAREEVMKLIRGYQVTPLYLDNLQDDTINQIVINEPFNISLNSAVSRIAQISKGNPRLAIMAAKVFNQSGTMESISDVSNIYHDYFQSVIDDKQVFNDLSARKVMGLLAFFKTIDITDENDRLLLASFGIDADEFFIISEQLELMELVDIYDRSVVRIAEQILATYYFYLTFIRDRNISFELLINRYFASQYYRFRDAISPVLEAFDAQFIISSTSSILLSYLDAIRQERTLSLQFLELFGIYFPDQTLSYINSLVQAKKSGQSVITTSPFGNQDDPVISITSRFFNHLSPDSLTALELAVQYSADDEAATKSLTEVLKQSFYPTDIDLLNSFERQHQLIDFLLNGKLESKFFTNLYYNVLPHLVLGVQYNERFYIKKEKGFQYHSVYADLRREFWVGILSLFSANRESILDMLIKEFVDDKSLDNYAMNFDEPFIYDLIINHLNSNNFKDCYFMQGFTATLNETYGRIPEKYENLVVKFNSQTYKIYDALVFKYLDHDEFGSDYNAIEIYRRQQLEINLPIKTFDDFRTIHEHLTIICHTLLPASNNLYEGLGRLISIVASKNAKLTLEVLAYFITHNVMTEINPARIFYALFQNEPSCNEKLFDLLKTTSFSQQQFWLERYFDCIPDVMLTETVAEELLICYKTLKSSNSPIFVKYLLRYEKARKNTVYELLNDLYERREKDNNFTYKIEDNFLSDFPELIDTYPDFVQKLYLQQEVIDSHFDQSAKQFKIILAKIPQFFNRYIDFFIKKRGYSYYSRGKHFGSLWQWPNGRDMIYNAIVKIGNEQYLYSAADLCACFFHPLAAESKQKALDLLDDIISAFSNKVSFLNLILNLVRNHIPDVYWDYVRKVIASNDDLEIFKKLQFYNNHFSSSGNQIWDDFKVAQLGKVYEIITDFPNRLNYIDHRDWLSRKINDHKTYADQERRMIFRGLR